MSLMCLLPYGANLKHPTLGAKAEIFGLLESHFIVIICKIVNFSVTCQLQLKISAMAAFQTCKGRGVCPTQAPTVRSSMLNFWPFFHVQSTLKLHNF